MVASATRLHVIPAGPPRRQGPLHAASGVQTEGQVAAGSGQLHVSCSLSGLTNARSEGGVRPQHPDSVASYAWYRVPDHAAAAKPWFHPASLSRR